jgi:hypothetical protein
MQYLIYFVSADVSTGQDMTGYYPRETDRSAYHSLRENEALGASYDRYLRNGVQARAPSVKLPVVFLIIELVTNLNPCDDLTDALCWGQ